MIRSCRELLRRHLPAETFQHVRSGWWHCTFYLPHSVASVLVRSTPKVQEFREVCSPELSQQLRSVNVLAPTHMCRVMTKYGSDKGQGWHNYTTVYSALLGKLRNQPLRIFELGLGTDNPNLASSMRANGCPGASLRGWRELFPRALVFGADIDRDILIEEDRIKTFWCDQLDGLAIRDLWLQPVLRGGFDLIVDDGLHTFEANTSFLEGSLEQLRPGGIFVIEDVVRETIGRWCERLGAISKQLPNYDLALVELPNSRNHYDNNLVIIRRCG